MRQSDETYIGKWKRMWHLHCQGWVRNWAWPVLLALLFVGFVMALNNAFRSFGSQVQNSTVWQGLKPATQYLIMGTFLEVVGLAFFQRRLKARTLQWTIWQIRSFVAECLMIVGGLACLIKAARLF